MLAGSIKKFYPQLSSWLSWQRDCWSSACYCPGAYSKRISQSRGWSSLRLHSLFRFPADCLGHACIFCSSFFSTSRFQGLQAAPKLTIYYLQMRILVFILWKAPMTLERQEMSLPCPWHFLLRNACNSSTKWHWVILKGQASIPHGTEDRC